MKLQSSTQYLDRPYGAKDLEKLGQALRFNNILYEDDGYWHLEIPNEYYKNLLNDPFVKEVLGVTRLDGTSPYQDAIDRANKGEGIPLYGVFVTPESPMVVQAELQRFEGTVLPPGTGETQ